MLTSKHLLFLVFLDTWIPCISLYDVIMVFIHIRFLCLWYILEKMFFILRFLFCSNRHLKTLNIFNLNGYFGVFRSKNIKFLFLIITLVSLKLEVIPSRFWYRQILRLLAIIVFLFLNIFHSLLRYIKPVYIKVVLNYGLFSKVFTVLCYHIPTKHTKYI